MSAKEAGRRAENEWLRAENERLRAAIKRSWDLCARPGGCIPWRAGDPCRACGSTDTGEGLPHEGAFCRSCGRSDDDD